MDRYSLVQMRALISAGSVSGIKAIGTSKGYILAIATHGGRIGILMSRRRERTFVRLDTLAAFLLKEGISTWCVEMDVYRQDQRSLV